MSDSQVSLNRRETNQRFTSDDRMPNQETCFLCGKDIEQDDDTREWFPADLYYKPTVSDFLDSFETQQGWVCSTSCFNDRVALNEDDTVPAPVGIHLVLRPSDVLALKVGLKP